MSRRRKSLTEEDLILWSRVARTAVPLKGRTYPEEPEQPATKAPADTVQDLSFPAVTPVGAPIPPQTPKKKELVVRKLDQPTRTKLAKGRLEITGRIDLHGMTQDEAHAVLQAFLFRAYHSGQRYVLVITGKGSTGEGVLRRAVPRWLASDPFRQYVGSYEDAARHHGGHGALYVRLRKRGIR
ncbi:Smr/MutS family protein [Chelativorans composti]|jgi:Uncharacterized protein conserved in bacteria|uniref:Smr/MutS family protein n=1 Tax=Chelativorans composti TaxID=768533 RepID=A0ABW5DH62_9HYPH|nr:DNA mismatch repair protein MutS [bacterium SGD-2]